MFNFAPLVETAAVPLGVIQPLIPSTMFTVAGLAALALWSIIINVHSIVVSSKQFGPFFPGTLLEKSFLHVNVA